MGKYLKLFETHADYAAYINGNEKILPNVSYCEDNNEVHYNPWVETRLIATFNNISENSAFSLYSYGEIFGVDVFNDIEINGVIVSPQVLDNNFGEYSLIVGDNIVKYALKNTIIPNRTFCFVFDMTSITIPNYITTIGDYAFQDCTGLTSITIPNTVTTIGYNAFEECASLTNVTISSGVRYIDREVFYNCSRLTSVTVEAATPPSLGSDAFYGNASGRKIYVPAESVETYKAASGWSTYASDIEAIPTI